MNFGRVVLVDPSDEDSVIAVMEFTPWDQLTEIDKENLNFISTFLHQSG
jgi:hypothetical protein